MGPVDEIAGATLRIKCGNYLGSGFLVNNKFVISNTHITKNGIKGKNKIFARKESGERFELECINFSPQNAYDLAIFEPKGSSIDRISLDIGDSEVSRGEEVYFSGFPFEFGSLLVQEALIAGPFIDNRYGVKKGFYLDGSVNKGSSGGPVVGKKTGKVIGYLTSRHFTGRKDLDKLQEEVKRAKSQLQNADEGGVIVAGVDPVALTKFISGSLDVLQHVIRTNANTGLGIAYNSSNITELLPEE